MHKTSLWTLLLVGSVLGGCSLAPDFALPETKLPAAYKEQLPDTQAEVAQGQWKPAIAMEAADRGKWWRIFGDEKLDLLQHEALAANQSLRAAAARVEQSRALAETKTPSFLPDLDIGGNAVRAQPSSAGAAAFGGPANAQLKPYTLYMGEGVLSYEADLFGRVRDNYKAYVHDSEAEESSYQSTLLMLQGDVAQHYFNLRALDTERKLLRETVAIRTEASRIMQKRFNVGSVSEVDTTRIQSELALAKADLIALDARRAQLENALAVLLGKMPSEFTFAEYPLEGVPPVVPSGLPSSLLERRPDVSRAIAAMQAANSRIGVARTAFFPRLLLTTSGGYQSSVFSELFDWSSRTWALGQTAGTALTMSIFDSGRNFANLDVSKSAYEEAVANYRQQVLVSFRDVEDNLTFQRLLEEQSRAQDAAAEAATRTTQLIEKRYEQGDVDYFQVVDTQRLSLAAERAAVQIRGQRFLATIGLIRALGGGWDDAQPQAAVQEPDASLPQNKTPVTPDPKQSAIQEKPEEKSAAEVTAPEPQKPLLEEKSEVISEPKQEQAVPSGSIPTRSNDSGDIRGTVLETTKQKQAAPETAKPIEVDGGKEDIWLDVDLGMDNVELEIVPAGEALNNSSPRSLIGHSSGEGTELQTK
jgi:multidrug efflux system outer membrane protein